MASDNSFMGEQKVGKLLLKFSIPCVLSLLISALYNIIDQIFIGNSEVGMLGIAATSVVFPLTIIAQAFAWCFGDGTAAFMSIAQGEEQQDLDLESRKKSRISKAIGTMTLLTFVMSLVILAIFYPLENQILYGFGASENSIGYANDYFTIILGFFPVFMLMNMMNAIIRADGSPTWSMISMGGGAIINIIFDPVFIYGCGWGVTGAAWATVMGQVVSFVVAIVYFTRSKVFRLSLKSLFIPDFRLMWMCVKLGISSFITQISIVAISLTCNNMLAKYGALSIYGPDIPIAIIGIETKVFTIVINIVVGIVLGGQPIIGYNYGAGKFDRVRQTYKIVLIATLIVGAAVTILFEAYPQGVVSIFGTGNESADYDAALYMQYGVYTFRIFLSLIIFTCVIKISSIFFQSLGKPVHAMIASLIRDIVFFIPLVCIIPVVAEKLEAGSGIFWLLFAAPAADLLGIIVTIILTILIFKGLKKEELHFMQNAELAEKFTQQNAAEASGAVPAADASTSDASPDACADDVFADLPAAPADDRGE
ncbi:MAG: MATE family efflux transporter [Clostridia bacterium]|nr:MATE family efflux transporter [Clostridia bacterium]